MRVKTISLQKMALASSLVCLFLVGWPTLTQAGCGCDKPPPAPAVVIPSAAFTDMPITLSYNGLKVGQTWNVSFQSGATTATVQAAVKSQRDLTDPSGMTYKPQLIVPVPPNIPVGPTSIQAYTLSA